ncbi:MAG: nucleotide exchange factor GrpE [Patescibacteria group bacterium]
MTKQPNNPPEDDISFVSEENEGDARIKGKSEKKLREELAVALKDRQEYLEGWQRTKADFVNLKRNALADEERSLTKGASKVLLDVITALDTFERAFEDKAAWESAPKNWSDGIMHIYADLLKTLEKNGVEVVNPVGEHFSPHEHESVSLVPVENKNDDGTIVAVLQKGYRMKDLLLRPARVVVGEFKGE